MDRIRGTEMSGSQKRDLLEEVKKKKITKEQEREIMALLPHRYGFPWYRWARAFYKARAHQCFLVAANQVSKSSTQIRKIIEWATNDSLWPELWKTTPRQFWYLYPNGQTATAEFDLKWVPEFMPRGKMKQHAKCGWEAEYQQKKIFSVKFNSGVTIFFKTYSQNVMDLQSGTVHYIAWDEEIPMPIYDELIHRVSAVDGYMSGVFTATLNQDFWKLVMEGEGEEELLKEAFKLQVSKYDCLTYEDGTPGVYTEEKILREIAMCKSATEVNRRIFGKFVTEEGRKYPAFEYERHMIKPTSLEVPDTWSLYVGIDIGTGGLQNHPAAIVFVAINPLGTLGVVVDGWRGDGVETTSEDVLNKFLELKAKRRVEPVQIFYDWHSKDFEIIASRAGVALTKANKARDFGDDILNTLFKGQMLLIYETEELRKLGTEFSTLMGKNKKTNAKDDFIDACRYCVVGMPWDWNSIRSDAEVKTIEEKTIETRPLTDAEYSRWVECQRKKIPYDELDKVDNYEAHSWEEFEEELTSWESNYDV